MSYDLARAHYEIGRHLDRADPARRAHLELAARRFDELGAMLDVSRSRAALAS